MHALFNSKRADVTMKNIAAAEGDSKDLWRALDRTMGKTVPKAEYVHTANNFADFF